MEETENKFPVGYIEEALKLKDRHMKKMKEYLQKSRKLGNRGRDFSSEEERKINQEFNHSLDALQKKYHI